ncbi:unnamed protein product [Notodromas monacha]|uniref:GTP-binding protein REM 1 n=1 Tax=Notodromas monacha TaxID=399045 RepID=A0A7R9BNA0_9CRUS|nr:unnamed protein product [Notodromas monacha]CAG0917265.1 unnamed protein product [Notodromas monacha]
MKNWRWIFRFRNVLPNPFQNMSASKTAAIVMLAPTAPMTSSGLMMDPGSAAAQGRLKQRSKAHRSQSARPPNKPVIRLQRGRTRDLEESELMDPMLGDPVAASSSGPCAVRQQHSFGTPEGSPMPGARRKDYSRSAALRRSRVFASPAPSGPSGAGVEDEDSYRLRNFSLTPKGSAGAAAGAVSTSSGSKPEHVRTYRVALLGVPGVGKNALVNQFMTSECINVYERSQSTEDSSLDISLNVVVNGIECELVFTIVSSAKMDAGASDCWTQAPPDAFLLQYSVTDKGSWERLEHLLARLQSRDLLRNRAAILVGNKTDLVRSRAVSDADGKGLASSYHTKFVEISVACNHNVDELLVGLVNQIRLHEGAAAAAAATAAAAEKSSSQQHVVRRPTTLVRASRRVKRVFSKVWGKVEDKDCDNLSVL